MTITEALASGVITVIAIIAIVVAVLKLADSDFNDAHH
jgi:hypothetical protein